MPKRPPKKWMKDCIKGVKKGGGATDAGAVCGAQWYHKMSRKAKEKAMRRD